MSSRGRTLAVAKGLIVVIVGLLAAAAAVGNLLSPAFAAVIAALGAGSAAVSGSIVDWLGERKTALEDRQRAAEQADQQRAEEARRRLQQIQSLVLDWPLSPRDVTPEDLGATPLRKAPAAANNGDPKPYIARDVDEAELIPALSSERFVLVYGPSKAGKTRTAFEAVRRAFEDALLIVPIVPPEDHPQALRELFGQLDIVADAGDKRLVVWLDDVQRYIRFRALDAALLRKWRIREPATVVVATIREAELLKLREDENLILQRATRIYLQNDPSEDELERASRAYPGQDFRRGIGVRLADVPLLVDRFEVSASGDFPQAHALVCAAVDWERATSNESIAKDELWLLARLPEYRANLPSGTSFTDEDLEPALGWATDRLPSGIALLIPTDDERSRFEAFDYLIDYAGGAVEERRGERPIPPGLWEAALSTLDAAGCLYLGLSAQYHQLWTVAERALTRARDEAELTRTADFYLGLMKVLLGEFAAAQSALESALVEPEDDESSLDPELRLIAMVYLSLALMGVGLRSEAETIRRQAIDLANAGDADPVAVVVSLNVQVSLALLYGRPEARELAEQSVALAEEQLPLDHPLRIEGLVNLARGLQNAGELERAEAVVEEAVDLASNAVGPRHFLVGLALLVRGSVRRSRGDLPAARADVERALAVQRQTLGPSHQLVGESLLVRGRIKEDQGDLSGAKADIEAAATIIASVFTDQSIQFATALYALSGVKRDGDDESGALVDLDRVIGIEESILGADDLQVGIVLHERGVVKERLGDLVDSKQDLVRALTIKRARLGPDDVLLAYTHHSLGRTKRLLGDLVGSKEDLERALTIKSAQLQPDDVQLAYTKHELALTIRLLGDLAGAEAHLNQAITIKESSLGPEALSVGYSLHERGVIKRDLGDLAGAQTDLEHSVRIKESNLDATDSQIAVTLYELGKVDAELGKDLTAEAALRRAVEIYQHAFPEDESYIAQVLLARGRVLARLGRSAEAKEHLEWALGAGRYSADDEKAKPILDQLHELDMQLPAGESGTTPGVALTGSDVAIVPLRRWVFELRRRAIERQDMRQASRPSLESIIETIVLQHRADGGWDTNGLAERFARMLPSGAKLDLPAPDDGPKDVVESITRSVRAAWDARAKELGDELLRALEQFLMLQVIDEEWPAWRSKRRASVPFKEPRDPASPETPIEQLRDELAAAIYESFLTLLFHVEVTEEKPESPRAPSSIDLTKTTASASTTWKPRRTV